MSIANYMNLSGEEIDDLYVQYYASLDESSEKEIIDNLFSDYIKKMENDNKTDDDNKSLDHPSNNKIKKPKVRSFDEHAKFLPGYHYSLSSPKYFEDDNNINLISNWKLESKGKYVYLLYKHTHIRHTSDPTCVSNKILYHNGSPYYGCPYKYRYCEEYNYGVIHFYKTRIYTVNYAKDKITIRDTFGNYYNIENNKSNKKLIKSFFLS